MPTVITIHGTSGRAAVTVKESVEEITKKVNAALKEGPQFVVFNNTSDQQVAVRADTIQGFFAEDGLDVTVGRAGVGAAMMQMNRRTSIGPDDPGAA